MSAVAIAFSMIVEMTSLTPRVALSRPAMPAHIAPTSMATRTMTSDVQRAGQRRRSPPTTAATQRGEPVLAVDADVEQVHPEADGHGERGQVVRRRPVEDLRRGSRGSVP